MAENDFAKLEQALFRAGQEVSYPPTPPLAARVRAQIEAAATPGAMRLPRWVVLTVAALVLALALLLAFPATREALAQFLGLRTIRILPATPTPTLPLPPTAVPGAQVFATPTSTPAPVSTARPVGARFQCCATTLADAQARAKFRMRLPPDQTPSQVYLQDLPFFGGVQQLVLVFGDPAAPRIILYEASGVLYGKVVNSGTLIEETQVGGQRALWLTGAPHALVYLDARGQPQLEYEQNIVGNTLAWEASGLTFRLETPLSKDAAIAFAESLR